MRSRSRVALLLLAIGAVSCRDDGGDAAGVTDAAVVQDGRAPTADGSLDGSLAVAPDADVDVAHDARVDVTTIPGWPDHLQPGRETGICRVTEHWYTTTTCRLHVTCDGPGKLVTCERAEVAYKCTCFRYDLGGGEEVRLPMNRFGGTAFAPCVAAYEACPDS